MKPEKFETRPEKVQKAILRGDTETLSEMGRLGGLKAADNNEARRAHKKRIKEQRDKEDRDHVESANEHILTIDGEDPEEIRDAANG
jgi:hypothetical protein